MNRRVLLASVGAGITSVSGCLRLEATAENDETNGTSSNSDRLSLSERWAANTGVDYIVTDGGKFYFNGWNVAGRAVPGDQVLWTSEVSYDESTGNLGADAIAIGDDIAVFGFFSERQTVETPGAYFSAQDITTGEEIWNLDVPAPDGEFSVLPKGAVIVDETAVLSVNIPGGDYMIYGVDIASGQKLWTKEPDYGHPQYVDAYQGEAYLGLGSEITRVNPRTGSINDRNESWRGDPGQIHGNSLFVSSRSSLNAFPLTGNGVEWSTDQGGTVNNLLVDNSIVVTGTSEGDISAFDRQTGDLQWEASINGAVWQIELTSDHVWVANRETGLTAYSRSDGQNVHRSTQPIERSDIGIVSETILFGSDTARAYDIETA